MKRILGAALACLVGLDVALAAETPLKEIVTGLPAQVATASRAKTDSVPVIVTLAMFGADKYADDMSDPASRANAKRAVKATVDAFLADRLPGKVVAPMRTAPRFAAKLTTAEIRKLAADSSVQSIEYDAPVPMALMKSIPFIQMDKVLKAGGTGAGGTVVVIDTGDDPDHPFIGTTSRRMRELNACFRTAEPLCANGETSDIGVNAADASSGQVHGTHVAGIAIGSNPNSGLPRGGVAREAGYIAINVFSSSDLTSNANMEAAFEYVEDLVDTDNNVHNIRAVNLSIGGGSISQNCDRELASMKRVIDRLRKKGVATVFAAGNEGYTNSTGGPACISSAVTVSATTKAAPLAVSSYSNVGLMTDLFAPGGEFGACVRSSVPGGKFASFCGTSMAAPHVTGVFDVLKQLYPAASVSEILYALQATGTPITDDRNGGRFKGSFIQVEKARDFLADPKPVANDARRFATRVQLNRTYETSNAFATLESGEPAHVTAHDGGSVWFRYNATAGVPLAITTANSDFDTTLAVYPFTASGDPLPAPVATNDNEVRGSVTSRVEVLPDTDTSYLIAVSGKGVTQRGSVALRLGVRPPNDHFADAAPIIVGIAQTADNTYASLDAGEKVAIGTDTHSLWWSFTAPASRTYTITTLGSGVSDTVLAVYKGDELGSLKLVAKNDEYGSGSQSLVRISAEAGVTYRIQAMGYWTGEIGRIKLSVR